MSGSTRVAVVCGAASRFFSSSRPGRTDGGGSPLGNTIADFGSEIGAEIVEQAS